ncbi:MAG: GNAT family N-acetyltransferase [Cyanobacteria bacterium J06636_16]
MEINWIWKRFEAISGVQMHAILAVRQTVFVVEQGCIYQDADELDQKSWHLLGCDEKGELVAYARITLPGTRYPEPSFGRVLTVQAARGRGLGRQIVQQCLAKCGAEYPRMDVRISAQTYLEKFYQGFGFTTVSQPYDDQGIEHVDMLLSSTRHPSQ